MNPGTSYLRSSICYLQFLLKLEMIPNFQRLLVGPLGSLEKAVNSLFEKQVQFIQLSYDMTTDLCALQAVKPVL